MGCLLFRFRISTTFCSFVSFHYYYPLWLLNFYTFLKLIERSKGSLLMISLSHVFPQKFQYTVEPVLSDSSFEHQCAFYNAFLCNLILCEKLLLWAMPCFLRHFCLQFEFWKWRTNTYPRSVSLGLIDTLASREGTVSFIFADMEHSGKPGHWLNKLNELESNARGTMNSFWVVSLKYEQQ